MTVENASYPEELDASLPLGTDFKSEGDNHIRLLKQVLKNALGTTQGIASEAEAGAITGVSNVKLATLLRVWEQVTARIATQIIAEGGTDDSRLMTSLKTNQYVSARLATQALAEGNTDNTKLMTSLRVFQQVTARLADEATAEARTDNTKLLTPLSGAQMANALIDALKANQATAEAGASTTTLMTPLASRQHGDVRYLKLAQTTALTRGLLLTAFASDARSVLGLGAAATAGLSSSTASTSTTTAATSAAVNTLRNYIDGGGRDMVAGINYILCRKSLGDDPAINAVWFPDTGVELIPGRNYPFFIQRNGTVTVYAQHRTLSTSSYVSRIRVLKNGSQVSSWSVTGNTSWTTRTVNVSVSVGDVITVQHRADNSVAPEQSVIRNVQIRGAYNLGTAA